MTKHRITVSQDELRWVVGALRERIDGYSEQLSELSFLDTANEESRWLEDALKTLQPLERRLTRIGQFDAH